MKSYLDLIPISAKVHRKQNRLTITCIILAVFLVTVIFSITDVWLSSESESLIARHGNYHIVLSSVPENTVKLIGKQDNIAAISQYGMLNGDALADYRIGISAAVLVGAENPYISDIRNFAVEGNFPKNDSEVMLSARAKEDLGINAGGSVTISTPAGDFSYTVSGFCDDAMELTDRGDGVIYAYTDMDAFGEICLANGISKAPQYYIQFDKHASIKKAVSEIKTQYGLADDSIEENMLVLGMAGQSAKQQMTGIYPLAAAMFMLILIAGVLMISSCMNSNVAQRTKFFGMLRCTGASKKQIMRFVRLEALNWCRTAIPIGCGIGVAVTWILCKILRYLVKGEFSSFVFKLSTVGIACGIAVGIITVLLAAHSPAKRAARVSPMAAVSGGAEDIGSISRAANTRLFRTETALGINHAVAAKKNLTLMTLSFAFTIILFLSFFALLDFARALVPSAEDFKTDIAVSSVNSANDLDKSMKAKMEQVAGVDKVFSNSFALGIPAEINGEAKNIDFMSYDNNLLEWAKDNLISGDISKVYGSSGCALASFNKDSRLDVGDKIKIGGDVLEIAAVSSQSIMGGSNPIVCCSEETFTRVTGEEDYMLLNVMLSRDATEETVSRLRTIAEGSEFADRRGENRDLNASFWVARLAAYGFLAIIALITVFNIMNSISMSVSARIKQYGAMRAVGMSVRQLRKMIAAEAATYAVCGSVIGCAAGLYLHRLIITKLILEHFGGVWKFPAGPISVVLAIVALSCIAAVYAPSKRVGNMAITDTINEQ